MQRGQNLTSHGRNTFSPWALLHRVHLLFGRPFCSRRSRYRLVRNRPGRRAPIKGTITISTPCIAGLSSRRVRLCLTRRNTAFSVMSQRTRSEVRVIPSYPASGFSASPATSRQAPAQTSTETFNDRLSGSPSRVRVCARGRSPDKACRSRCGRGPSAPVKADAASGERWQCREQLPCVPRHRSTEPLHVYPQRRARRAAAKFSRHQASTCERAAFSSDETRRRDRPALIAAMRNRFQMGSRFL
jgi:hypothetical protein